MGYILFYYLYRSAVGPAHIFCTTGTVCTACESKRCRGVDVAAPCHASTADELQLGHVILLDKTTAETVVVSGRFSQKERSGC